MSEDIADPATWPPARLAEAIRRAQARGDTATAATLREYLAARDPGVPADPALPGA